jgi:hypothetical protein
MLVGRAMAATFATVAILVGAAGPVRAQSPEAPATAPFQVGPLALAPVVRLTNLGYDSNVFNRDVNPQGDSTATLSPEVEAWLRLPRARFYGRHRFDFYYFKELTDLRAMDTDTTTRIDLPLNRLIPFVEATLANTRHRQNLEIDAIARRRNDAVTVGADLRLTGKVSAGLYARRSRLAYEPNSLYRDTDLASVLNHTSSGEGGRLRYSLTPLTSIAVDIEQYRDRFKFTADRHSDSLAVTPSVEFKPFALVSGRAAVGYRQRKFLAGDVPDFNGTVAFVDLTYTFRERTRFGVAARRELEYSYLIGRNDYVVGELTGLVTQRLGERWDAGGSLGRASLSYGQQRAPTRPPNPTPSTGGGVTPPAVTPPATIADETVLTTSVNVGYNFGRTRAGFQLEFRGRQAGEGEFDRGYERLRVGTSLTHTF